MADYGALLLKQVADAINNKITGLNSVLTYKSFVSEGRYDPVAETRSPVFTEIAVTCVEVHLTFDEVNQMDMDVADLKLLIPGSSIPEPQVVNDKVIRNGEEWFVKKYVGVPGGSLWSVYITRT